MKHIIIFILVAIFFHLSFAQEATLHLEWTQTEYLNAGGRNPPMVLVDEIGNTFVCAKNYSPGTVTGFLTIKYDSLGNLLWRRNYDTGASDILKDCALLSDGSIVVAGIQEYPVNFDGRVRIFRYDTDGDTIWTLSHKEEVGLNTSMQDMIIDEEDNIYIVGNNYQDTTGEQNLTLTKFNNAGQIVWDNWYSDSLNYHYAGIKGKLIEDRIVVFADGFSSYLIHQVNYEGETLATAKKPYQDIFSLNIWFDEEGYTYIGDETGEYKITKIDLDGDTLWTYVKPPVFDFPNLSEGSLTNTIFDIDNNIYIAGHYYTEETRADCLTTKLDADGNVLWEKIFRLTDEFLNDAPDALFVDENYVYLAARCVSMLNNPENYDYALVIYTLEGEEVTHITYNNKKIDWIKSMVVKDNYIYITGNTYDDFPDPIHALTQKYRLDISSDLPSIVEAEAYFKLHPNPAQDKVQVALDRSAIPSNTPLRIQIYNVQGRLVKIASLASSTDLLDFKDLVAGLYFVHVMAGKESLGVEKLVVAR